MSSTEPVSEPMPKRQTPAAFTVVVDSNALFPKEPANLVSPKFMAAWKQSSGLGTLTLVVPEVVMGERLYQLVATAEKSTQNATKNFDTIGKVSGCAMPILPTTGELKAAVEARFEKWIAENKAKIAPVPYDKIDWKQVVCDSIWRVEPFIPAGEDEDSEKGFRDRLILETLHEILRNAGEEQVVFISHDNVLRETANAQFGAKTFTAYDGIDGFVSYLKLSHENLRREFVQALIRKVPSVFYAAGDPNCIYLKSGVPQRIATQFATSLDFLFDAEQSPSVPLKGILELITKPQATLGVTAGFYQAASEERIFIDATEFVQSSAPAVFHWKTRLRFIRLFQRKTFQQTLGDFLGDKVRVAKFDVFWQVTVDEEEKFSNANLGDIKLVEQTTEAAWLSKAKYGFADAPQQQRLFKP